MPHAKCAVPFTRQQARTHGWSGSRICSRGGRKGVCGVAGDNFQIPGPQTLGSASITVQGRGWMGGGGGGQPQPSLSALETASKPCRSAPGSARRTVRAVEMSRSVGEGWLPGWQHRDGLLSGRRFRAAPGVNRGAGSLQGTADSSVGERRGCKLLQKAGMSRFCRERGTGGETPRRRKDLAAEHATTRL
jgi:hypothetical protein